MHILQLRTTSPLKNFTYMILPDAPTDRYSAIVVDPWDADQVLEVLDQQKRKLSVIINTHEHDDHTRGNAALVAKTGAPVWGHPQAEGKIPHMSRGLHSGERITFSETDSDKEYLLVVDSPGHTFASLCLLAVHYPEPFAIVTGDTFFNAGVGNCHNGGDPRALYTTIEREFMPLSDDIIVYPGHDYLENNLAFSLNLTPENSEMLSLQETFRKEKDMLTNMGVERKINQFLRLDAPDLKEALKKRFPNQDFNQRDQVFLTLRQLRNKW